MFLGIIVDDDEFYKVKRSTLENEIFVPISFHDYH